MDQPLAFISFVLKLSIRTENQTIGKLADQIEFDQLSASLCYKATREKLLASSKVSIEYTFDHVAIDLESRHKRCFKINNNKHQTTQSRKKSSQNTISVSVGQSFLLLLPIFVFSFLVDSDQSLEFFIQFCSIENCFNKTQN